MARVEPAQGVAFEAHAPVLVIGAGAAGLVAALRVRALGVEVLVLERDAVPRGSTALSAGLIPAAGTRFQRAAGIADSPALFAADIMAKAHGEPQPAAVAPWRRRSHPPWSGWPTRTACRSPWWRTSPIPAIPRGACTACPRAPAPS